MTLYLLEHYTILHLRHIAASNYAVNVANKTVTELSGHAGASYFLIPLSNLTLNLQSHALRQQHTLFSGIHKHPAPEILHSDRGSEYTSDDMRLLCELFGITQSMSRAGCPWENGYQESFYSQFKVDLGDPGRFSHLGELVYEIYRCIYIYNTSRIHTALKMPPQTYALQHQVAEYLSSRMVS